MASGFEIVMEEVRHKDYHSLRFFCLMIVFLFSLLTIMQLSSAKDFEDYIAAPAYVTDRSSRTQLRKSGSRTLYSFTVHWFFEGNEYQKRFTDEFDPHLDLDEVHIAPDNSDMTLGSYDGSIQGSMMTMTFSAVALVIWFILFKCSKNIYEEVKENCYMAIGMGGLMAIVGGFFYYVTSTDPKYKSSSPTVGALALLGLTGLLLGIVVLIYVKHKTKRAHSKR
ncbi:hypothetical protein [Butyrivibrio sp. JL13D10]|uniref:hypothetical protein n=1 Tax=Butyrivibrio sp. JL13D10 TaxID=3236815 RepID=UPI0038B676F0